MPNTWKFEIVDFGITLDNSCSTSCSVDIFPVLYHVFINKLVCLQRSRVPAVPCSLWLSAWRCHSDLHRAPLGLSWVTQQQLNSLKLHILIVCPSCCSAREWCSLQSQDYLEENQEGFKFPADDYKLGCLTLALQAELISTLEWGGGKVKEIIISTPSVESAWLGMAFSSSAAGWKSRKPQQLSSSHRMGMFSIHSRSNLWDSSFPCQRFPFPVLSYAPDHCTPAAGPWHGSGEDRLGRQGLFKV